jgi:hypothetical protein
LPEFSKTAEDFFKLMAHFMITRVKDLPNMQLFEQYAAVAASTIGNGDQKREGADLVIREMKVRIDEYNQRFSPELSRIRFWILLVLILEVLLFVGSYISQRVIFQHYLDDLDRL